MEKIPAACAMDWSIELEKGLRSSNAAVRTNAITKIGERFHRWTSEPYITLGVADIYGLVPGEDRLFANTILIRLTNAFCTGDNSIRRSILKIFLLECKNVMKTGRNYNGILSKARVPNYAELLKRIKLVFDTGDVEAKELAMRLFGCLADLAKDSVHIRYIILTGIQSTEISEVKASLFAAGCLCRLSEDFARITLELVVGIVSLPQTSDDVKLEAIPVFSKMRCSSYVAHRAYKAGKTLIASLQQDDLKIKLVSSLSKLAHHSLVLIPEQVDLLLSFVTQESISLAKISKYLFFIVSKGVCSSNVEKNVLVTLINVLNNKKFSPIIRCELLRTITQIVCSIDVDCFFKFVLIVEDAAKSLCIEERFLSLRIIVDIMCKMKEKIRDYCVSFPEKWNAALTKLQNSNDERDGPTVLVCDISRLIMNEVVFLVKQGNFVRKEDLRVLFNLIIRLVSKYPSIACGIFDSLKCLTHAIFNFDRESNMKTDPICTTQKSTFSEVVLCICRLTIACLSILDEAGGITNEVNHSVESLVECIKKHKACDMFEIFPLELHSSTMFKKCRKTRSKIQEISALEFTKSMIRKQNNWEAYRTGVYACTMGAWFAAAFTFRKLISLANSDIYKIWLKSLILLTGGESEFKLILFPKVGIEMINIMQTEKEFGNPETEDWNNNDDFSLHGYIEKFAKVHSRIIASEEILAASDAENSIFYFQRWYLSLRAKSLQLIADILQFLALQEEQHNPDSMASELDRFSFRLNNIAKEYDLLSVSFMDIDSVSFTYLTRQALSYSMLAFCVSFSHHMNTDNIVETSKITVLVDLYGRLCNTDGTTTSQLQRLMSICKVANNWKHGIETNRCRVDRASLLLYKDFTESIMRIQDDPKEVKDERGLQGIKLLSEMIIRWMEIPCAVPKYYFRVRPCVGAELYIFNINSRTPNEISAASGSQLSVNLCIQLKNTSLLPNLRVAKIYCILSVNPSDYMISTSRQSEKNEMVELHDILVHHIKNGSNNCDADSSGLITSCVLFDTNDKGHGFSTCLIDVSELHAGVYPVKWHSCCVDKKGHFWSLFSLNRSLVLNIK